MARWPNGRLPAMSLLFRRPAVDIKRCRIAANASPRQVKPRPRRVHPSTLVSWRRNGFQRLAFLIAPRRHWCQG